jgi:8-amino-3,8-dideoxy-alpha-D-manno-octulosonate transaminase
MPGNEFIGEEELKEITSIFTEHNGYLYRYGGTKVIEFEKAFANKFNVRYAHAVSSGTAALKVALQALGVGPGDEVITQCHTFIATVEAIVETGATPVIVNVDKSLNMDPNSLRQALTEKTKVVIPVHMDGVACRMDEIMKVIYDFNPSIRILEDNAQSPGGTYKGQYLGTIGDMGIFSFDFGKMLTTGEGGMVVTNNKYFYERARGFADHGHADKPGIPRGEDDCIGLGFNYKMSELNGAMGLAQLRKLDVILELHKKNKQLIIEGIKDTVALREIPNPEGDIGDSIAFFIVDSPIVVSNWAPFPVYKKSNIVIFIEEWKKRGLPLKNLPSACKWHIAKYWKHIAFKDCTYGWANFVDHTVSIPIKAKMTQEDREKIVKNIKELMEVKT